MKALFWSALGWVYWQYIKRLRRKYRLQQAQQAVARGKGWAA